ncbi:MAG: CPBP family intramembrane glutamic endopeptidase [Myxococcota bacterium]
MIALTSIVAAAGALLAGVVAGTTWRRMHARPVPLVEVALAICGVLGVASTMTFALMWLWTGAVLPRTGTGDDDPFFTAALAGTVAGHLALLGWARGVGASLATRLVSLRWVFAGVAAGALGVVVSGLWVEALAALGLVVEDQEIVAQVVGGPAGAGRLVTLGFVVAGAPLLEELVFRGYVQTELARWVGPAIAAVASALCFGAFHLSEPAVVPVLTLIGGALAWLRMRSGSVWPSVTGHLVNNTLAMWLAVGS